MTAAIRFILVEPHHPANIGATARAMKTMGETALYLVNPSFFPSPAANALASVGVDILDHAIVTKTLSEALQDCQLIFATSGRDTVMNFPCIDLQEAAQIAKASQHTGHQVAIIFGTERTGLTNEELKLCHYHVRIPTGNEFSSLNLAQAVQVVGYELLMAKIPQSLRDPPSYGVASSSLAKGAKATHADTERFYTRLEALLRRVDYLKPGHDKIMLQKLRRLFQRAQLEESEVIILLGILSNIERRLT